MRKILIIAPTWVGDMVMAQSLFKHLKHQNSDIEIHVLGSSSILTLATRMPEIHRAIPCTFTSGKLQLKAHYVLGKALRAERYDQAIILKNSIKSALVPFFAHIPQRTSWLGEYRYGLINDIRFLNKQKHIRMVDRFGWLGWPSLQAGIKSDIHSETGSSDLYPQPALSVSDENREHILKKLHLKMPTKPLLILCPGAEFGVSKRWPPSYFAKVAAQKQAKGWEVWILGSEKENEIARELIACVHSFLPDAAYEQIKDLTGKTSIIDVIDLMSLATCVLSNDSGLMHIAAALNKPIVALYGSTQPEFAPPLTNCAEIISRTLSCKPCYQRVCPLGHFRCMVDIQPEEVLNKIDVLMHSFPETRQTSRSTSE